MSLFTLALAGEFKDRGVVVNSLWPRTAIATAAVRNEIGGADMVAACRKPEIVADAAHFILTRLAKECSGNFFLDDEVLLAAGGRDFAQYDLQAGAALQADFFVEALPGMLPTVNMIKPTRPS
jgi:citronellol/citronellal dehydrogenase